MAELMTESEKRKAKNVMHARLHQRVKEREEEDTKTQQTGQLGATEEGI